MWFIFVLQFVVFIFIFLFFSFHLSFPLFFPPQFLRRFTFMYFFVLFRFCSRHRRWPEVLGSLQQQLFSVCCHWTVSLLPRFFVPFPYCIPFFPQKYLTPHWSSTIHFHSVHGCVTPCELWGGRRSYIWLYQSENVRKCAKEKICLSLLSGFTWSFSRLLRQYVSVAFYASTFVPQSLFWSCLLVCA